MIPQHEPI